LTTLELDPALAGRARKNLARTGLAARATVVCADALAHLPRLEGKVDFIFVDIDKADYVRVLPDCHRLLHPQGLLAVDDVAFAEADSFNRAIFDDEGWRPVPLLAFLPGHSAERDGLCPALRR
jgi:predicted O-methyltransferase YrrM